MRVHPGFAAGVFAAAVMTASVAAGQSAPPVPRPAPFPGSTPPPATTAKPATPATGAPAGAPQDGAALDPKLAGIPILPGAQLLSSFDAGRGQHVFLLGTNLTYAEAVAFYKAQLRSSGSEIFRAPAMQQFDLGPFRSDTMSYRPSVVVKDHTWMDSPGYLHVSGTTETRFRTVIQIVPVAK